MIVPVFLLFLFVGGSYCSVPRGHDTIMTMLDNISGDLARNNVNKHSYNAGATEEKVFDRSKIPGVSALWYTSKKELDDLEPTRRALMGEGGGGLRGRKLWGGTIDDIYAYDSTTVSSSSYTIASIYQVFDFDSDAAEASGSGSNDGDWSYIDDSDYNDGSCRMQGFTFIGSSYSIIDQNGHMGCDPEHEGSGIYSNANTHAINSNQFRMNCLIDRNYEYILSSDRDCWLVGGGYKAGHNSGCQASKDSSHTELLRLGSICGNGACQWLTLEIIYQIMTEITTPVFRSYPTYVKVGGGGGDVELKMTMVDEYSDENSYSEYENWSEALLTAFSGYACADTAMTNEHISMIRSVKFKSSEDQNTYLYQANMEVAKWQAVYSGIGVAIGTAESICLSDDDALGDDEAYPNRCEEAYGYGNLQLFFGRTEMTRTFWSDQSMLTEDDYMLSTYWDTYGEFPDVDEDEIEIEYSGSQDNGDFEYDCANDFDQYTYHNWDPQKGYYPPCYCYAAGFTHLSIPLMNFYPTSTTPLIEGGPYESFLDPNIFKWDVFCDHQQNYVKQGGSNHLCLTGTEVSEEMNGGGFIEQPDSVAVRLFGLGYVNSYGGADLDELIQKIAKNVKWTSLTLAPAYVGLNGAGDVVMYFVHDPLSDIGQLYTTLCKSFGNPGRSGQDAKVMNNYCAHSDTTDTAYQGCWAADPDNNPNGYQEAPSDGNYCLYATIMIGPKFYSTDAQKAYLEYANDILDDWKATMISNGKQPSFTPQSNGKWCNGMANCLAFFYDRTYPFIAFDGQGNHYEYTSGYHGTQKKNQGNTGFTPGGQASSKVVSAAITALLNTTAAAVAGFLGILMFRKYRRRRRKGLSNYDIFFGNSRRRWKRKVKKFKKRRNKKDRKERERRADKDQDRRKSKKSSRRAEDDKATSLLESPSSDRVSKSPARYKWKVDEHERRGSTQAGPNKTFSPSKEVKKMKSPKSKSAGGGFQDVVAKNLKKASTSRSRCKDNSEADKVGRRSSKNAKERAVSSDRKKAPSTENSFLV